MIFDPITSIHNVRIERRMKALQREIDAAKPRTEQEFAKGEHLRSGTVVLPLFNFTPKKRVVFDTTGMPLWLIYLRDLEGRN